MSGNEEEPKQWRKVHKVAAGAGALALTLAAIHEIRQYGLEVPALLASLSGLLLWKADGQVATSSNNAVEVQRPELPPVTDLQSAA